MERRIGTVTDYFARIGVAAVRLTDGDLQVGDRIHIQGRTTDFTQVVESLQVEHQPVTRAARGTEVAVKVRERVRKNDAVLKVEAA
jgi:putative protease